FLDSRTRRPARSVGEEAPGRDRESTRAAVDRAVRPGRDVDQPQPERRGRLGLAALRVDGRAVARARDGEHAVPEPPRVELLAVHGLRKRSPEGVLRYGERVDVDLGDDAVRSDHVRVTAR